MIRAYAEVKELASYLHLPVQSGSDDILQLMKRGYTASDYIAKIDALKENRPGISISSDFIVGFPGETAEDFDATLDLIKRVGFDQSFSFIYSQRPGTPAATVEDHVSRDVKQQRLQQLQNLLINCQKNLKLLSVKMVLSYLVDKNKEFR